MGKHWKNVSWEKIKKSLGKRHFSQQNVEAAFLHIFDNKICLVEKKSDYSINKKRELGTSDSQKNKEIEKSDDPIRMYLREMGGVELLSREGEIAIAKRIEAGKDVMLNALSQSPITAQQFIEWNTKLQNGHLIRPSLQN